MFLIVTCAQLDRVSMWSLSGIDSLQIYDMTPTLVKSFEQKNEIKFLMWRVP